MKSWTRIGTAMVGVLGLGALFASCDSSAPSAMAPSNSMLARVALSQIPSLGKDSTVAIFGGDQGITNQGTHSLVYGSVGTIAASTKVTGLHSPTFSYTETALNLGTVNGLVTTNAPHGTPADLILAKQMGADALNAFNALAALPGGVDPGASSLGGRTLDPGVYKATSGTFTLQGTNLTLDAHGDGNAVWVFQMANTLVVGGTGARSVILANGAQAKNVYWQVGNTATINPVGGGMMVGTVLARSGIAISSSGKTTTTNWNGRALCLYGPVTLVNTVFNLPMIQVPSLGAAAPFVVFGGGAGMTNQGIKTVINGNIGTTGASTMLTGFHSSTFSYIETPLNKGAVNGLVITAAPQGTPADFTLAKQVAADALTAFNLLAGLPGGVDAGAGLLGGLTLAPGVYKAAAGSFTLIGSNLTLDAKGDPNAVWIFQMASSLTVGAPAAPRSVILTNGAQAKNVYWQVGSAATINGGGGGTMVGTIIARAGVTFSTAGNLAVTTLNGRALGLFASVTMVNTVINKP